MNSKGWISLSSDYPIHVTRGYRSQRTIGDAIQTGPDRYLQADYPIDRYFPIDNCSPLFPVLEGRRFSEFTDQFRIRSAHLGGIAVLL
jgi:hypothetical protein